MAAVSLFWDTNMAAVMSCENTLYVYSCREKEKLLQMRAAENYGRNCSASIVPPPLQIKCSFPNKVAIA